VRGSDHFSTTRLTPTNYETQAAAASDLGGIEISRNRLVITIGLQTITYNPESTALIIASGEAKARIVQQAIENPKSNYYPATVLQDLKNACFYLTRGAALLLQERYYREIQNKSLLSLPDQQRILIDLALQKEKKIAALTKADFVSLPSSNLLYQGYHNTLKKTIDILEKELQQRFTSTLEIPKNKTFLHTAPHHDDIMLGYLPYLIRLIREGSNKHYFNYLTSGFTAVANRYMRRILERLDYFVRQPDFIEQAKDNYFDPINSTARNQDVLLYLDGVAANNHFMREKAESQRLLRNMIAIFEEDNFENLSNRIDELLNYFKTQYPGKKDLPYIQHLKGMTREWEADVLWGYFGFNCTSVIHSRLGFYTGDIFTEDPEFDRDVLPILENIKRIKPDVVSVALDPESSGPDTHYKVLQTVTEALRIYKQKSKSAQFEIWGYRNVWFRFHPGDANAYIPVTLNTFAIMNHAFMNCFSSQAEASFPSYEYDGPFSKLAQKIQVEQYQMMKTLLGTAFFYENPDSRTRSTRGLVFLKKMTLEELVERSAQLRRSTENK
jgi:glucosamine-6-phosphate deaminase